MVAPSASGLPFLEKWGQALLLRLEAFLRQSERDVVLENVRDILDGFASNESCRSRLHVVEPDMLVEAARGGGLSKPPEIAWAGVVGRERHKATPKNSRFGICDFTGIGCLADSRVRGERLYRDDDRRIIPARPV